MVKQKKFQKDICANDSNRATNWDHERHIMEKKLDTIGWKAKGVIRQYLL